MAILYDLMLGTLELRTLDSSLARFHSRRQSVVLIEQYDLQRISDKNTQEFSKSTLPIPLAWKYFKIKSCAHRSMSDSFLRSSELVKSNKEVILRTPPT